MEEKACGENVELFRTLYRIKKADQHDRKLAIAAGQKYGWQSKEVLAFNAIIGKNDSIRLLQVQDIITTYGYPEKKLVGQASDVAFLVIHHSNNYDVQRSYLPLLIKLGAAGEIRRSSLALLEDRVLVAEGKPQKYGTQIKRNSETGAVDFFDIMDYESVNARRSAVGLGSLEKYAARHGIDPPH